MAEQRLDELTGQTTTGHDYDGIEELNTPLPRWWLWTFYATIIWGIGYTIAYPAWPMISGATTGLLGYSTRAEVAAEIEAHEAQNAALVEELLAADLAAFDAQSDLHRYAVARGGAVFRAQCSQCHGSGAAGAEGYPNLLDNDWLWGGELDQIAYTVRHGIRNETDEDAHWSEMPAFGEILEEEEIATLVGFLPSLATADADSPGAVLYADNCASCHGDAGLGDRDLGAPNLVDAIWLYGGDEASLTETITNARFGVMPAWGQRLSEADVRAVATYVHALGGGESSPVKAVVSALGLGLLTGCTADGLGPGPAVDRDPDNPVYGRLLYEDRCLSCHGPTGRGDGPAAAALPLPPANLRMLAAANDGVFDRDLVMSTIFEPPGSEASRMPAFGHSDLGPWILVEEDEEGRATPIPRDLLAIATYLETIQDM